MHKTMYIAVCLALVLLWGTTGTGLAAATASPLPVQREPVRAQDLKMAPYLTITSPTANSQWFTYNPLPLTWKTNQSGKALVELVPFEPGPPDYHYATSPVAHVSLSAGSYSAYFNYGYTGRWTLRLTSLDNPKLSASSPPFTIKMANLFINKPAANSTVNIYPSNQIQIGWNYEGSSEKTLRLRCFPGESATDFDIAKGEDIVYQTPIKAQGYTWNLPSNCVKPGKWVMLEMSRNDEAGAWHVNFRVISSAINPLLLPKAP